MCTRAGEKPVDASEASPEERKAQKVQAKQHRAQRQTEKTAQKEAARDAVPASAQSRCRFLIASL